MAHGWGLLGDSPWGSCHTQGSVPWAAWDINSAPALIWDDSTGSYPLQSSQQDPLGLHCDHFVVWLLSCPFMLPSPPHECWEYYLTNIFDSQWTCSMKVTILRVLLWNNPWGYYITNLPSKVGDARDVCSVPRLGRSPGGGHGNPLQYPCLENPMDRGAWWATVHRITKSQTQLK